MKEIRQDEGFYVVLWDKAVWVFSFFFGALFGLIGWLGATYFVCYLLPYSFFKGLAILLGLLYEVSKVLKFL